MLKFADLIEKHTSELAELDAITMGGPVGPQGFMIGATVATFRCEFSGLLKILSEKGSGERGGS